MTYYAQINLQSKACYAVCKLSGPVEGDHLVELDSYDISLLGKFWNGVDWQDLPLDAPEEEEFLLDPVESPE
jgi:hypothetical protein